MSLFYKKYEDHTLDYQGKKYFEKTFVIKKMDALLTNQQNLQKRSHEAETLLLKIWNNWLVRLLFSKQIKAHLEKYRNQKYEY